MNWFIIIFFLISIAIYAITRYHYLKKQVKKEKYAKIEAFENEKTLPIAEKLKLQHNVKLEFLTKEEAKGLININDQYIQNMNQPNLHARNCESIN